ncbi:hypothetical protein M514_25005 [Trichuris suis]|uniref:Uncharacterized protein n=1 Tax=Trichuris suis TaxID=68888 RepID=A0A085N021_9BILA|nr:hypothetical protein M514_25005 [Trichuris suis]
MSRMTGINRNGQAQLDLEEENSVICPLGEQLPSLPCSVTSTMSVSTSSEAVVEHEQPNLATVPVLSRLKTLERKQT